ncbi:MAG TPA: dihydroneopterin aldolase [Candidatus Thermoplasmatota archaeon]|nr:dihydroneopterin aldolase [Candidatus Thermoplasmatota archaeon]
MTARDAIRLRNMRFFTHVGCSSEERRVGQHLEMDIEFRLDLREAGTTDRIAASIDYAEAYRRVRQVVENHEANLLETIAERAAGAVLAMGAREVVVRVRKPTPPMPGAYADHAEVEIVRGRTEP